MASDLLSLAGRRVLITGASSGIGRETAIVLSRLGAEIVLSGRDEDRLKATLSQLEGNEHRVEAFDLDATPEIPRWVQSITSEGRPLYGLVHSAGVQSSLLLRSLAVEQFDRVVRTNLTAAVMLAKGFRLRGCNAGSGSVVLLSSVTGLAGRAGVAAYAASKSALIGLVKSLALELARDSIRINCVAPGFVKTPMLDRLESSLTDEQYSALEEMHPLGFGTPRDVAYAIAFLLADTGRWITGTTLVVDGGYTAH